jgi:hypothetical protein
MASFLLTPSSYGIPEIPGKQARFGKYFFKLVVRAPGASLVREFIARSDRILTKYENFDDFIRARASEQIDWFKRVMSWRPSTSSHDTWCQDQIAIYNTLEPRLLNSLYDLVSGNYSKKIRVDGNNHEIAFYFEARSQLEEFLENFPAEHFNMIKHMENSLMLSADLQHNQRVVKKRKTLRYKIFIRDQTRVTDNHRKLLEYLESLGTVVEITNKLRKDFSSVNPQSYYHNVYFYTSDLSVLSFAEIIAPGIIGRIQEIVEAPDT